MNEKILEIFEQSIQENAIDNELYRRYDVKKGLRNEDNTGVLVGLTKIADVVGYEMIDGKKTDAMGKLYYRGYEINDLIDYLDRTQHNGFEQTAFLILFGHLPNQEELKLFMEEIRNNYELPADFLELNLLRMPAKNLINKIQQAVLMLYGYDPLGDDTSAQNTLRQGISILAKMASIIAYSYQSKMFNFDDESLIIHKVKPAYSIAETILRLIRKDKQFTETEASVLDCMLILHMDHGGGNNSTFTNVVISSTGTDLYSALAGSIGALKGPRHGGANLAVVEMMKAVIDEIGITKDEQKIKQLIYKILDKQFYDHSGLVYGIGHAVYTLSDPRSLILQKQAYKLAEEVGQVEEFEFYQRFEKCAIECIKEVKGKNVASNVDFYSGFVYRMLNIPQELISPLFVCARLVGWLAHNIENKLYCDRIVRPATKYVGEIKKTGSEENENNHLI